ncbi:hypothetical protein X777_15670 [Ooceraea biroi]|uniref:DUF4817 domain-containing protein n=1 Tax=Ooceraea biroi TaxID=2015173 RepID=A0A026VV44_OOCBI|nr:hypothetical protein X777_15670 [Ooceraea biroi]
MYGRANGNCSKAQHFYQIFPQRRCPAIIIFISIHRRFRETGSFLPSIFNRECNKNIRTPAIEEQVIRRIEENPRFSMRQITLEMQNVSQLWRIMNKAFFLSQDAIINYHNNHQ